jgi:predicted permease
MNLLADLHHTVRQLRRAPAFALIGIVTLALGIGINMVVFGVLDALILRPLPVPQPRQIYTVQQTQNGDLTFSYGQYRDLAARNSSFSGIADYRIMLFGLTIGTGSDSQIVWGYEVSGNYFSVLGDQAPSGAPNIVLSYAAWQSHFQGDPDIVGHTVRLNRYPYTVVGIAPKSFRGTELFFSPEVWVSVHNEAALEGYDWIDGRMNQNTWLIGRLKNNVTAQQATANLETIVAQLKKQYPQSDEGLSVRLTRPGLFGDALGSPARAFLGGILLLASLVLLAACSNLGSLFAARAADRSRELAIRLALGATRSRLYAGLLGESALIALLGGAGGCVLATFTLRVLSAWRPHFEIPLAFSVAPAAPVFLFALGLTFVAALISGLLPIRQAARTEPNAALRQGAGFGIGRGRWSTRDILLGVQIALCSLLLVSSLVAVRGMLRALGADFGFDPTGVTMSRMDLHFSGLNAKQALAVERELQARAAQIPGVTSAAFANSTPLSVDQSSTGVFPDGTADFRPSNERFAAAYFQVSPGYFRTAGTRLLAGREFSEHDDAQSPRVAIVNELTARALFGSASAAIGRHLYAGSHRLQIVGVAENGKYATLSEDPAPALFYPALQNPNTSNVLLVRSHRPPSEMIPLLRQTIRDVDATAAVDTLGSWRDALALVFFPARAAAAALGIFGLLAISLAITGIFGLAAYTVARRMRELGIRVALGAQHRQVLRAALGRVLTLLLAGSATGLLLGLAGSRVLASIVYQARASDPLVLFATLVSMLLIGLLAAAIPARRALAVDPAILLRDE